MALDGECSTPDRVIIAALELAAKTVGTANRKLRRQEFKMLTLVAQPFAIASRVNEDGVSRGSTMIPTASIQNTESTTCK